MNRRPRNLIAVALSFAIPFTTAGAQELPKQENGAGKGDLELRRSEDGKGIQGRLLELDGVTPLAKRDLVLRNVETRDVIARLTTGEDGSFLLPELINGAYVLEWDGHAQFFEVRQDRPLRTIKILAPTGPGKGLRLAADVGSTLIMVGAGTAIGIVGGVAGGVIGYNLRHTTGDKFFTGGTSVGGLQFELSPSGDFGAVQVGQTRQRTFVLRNTSTERLAGVVSLSNTLQFSLLSGSEFDLVPGAVTTVTVRFAPTVVADHIGTVDATVTAGPPAVPQSKPLFGQGTQGPAVSPAAP